MTSGLEAKRKFCNVDSTKLKLRAPASEKTALSLYCSDRVKGGTDFVALHILIVVGRRYLATAEEPKGKVLYVLNILYSYFCIYGCCGLSDG